MLLHGAYDDLDPDERMDLLGRADAGVQRLERAEERAENRAIRMEDREMRLADRAENRAIRMEDRAMRLEDRNMRLLDRASAAAEREERRRIATEDRGERLLDKGARELADAIQKEGDKLSATGELTPTWIENHRDELDPEDYRHFYKQLEPETAALKTDPDTYARMRLRVANGEDIRSEARIALHQGDLATSDFNTLLNEQETRQGTGAAKRPPWAVQGETFIKQSLKVSEINPDPGAPQRLAQTLDQWSDWQRHNPNAKHEEAQKVYREMVKNTAVVNFGELLNQTSTSYAQGVRTPADLDAREAALVEKFAAKHGGDETALMNDPEFLKAAEELEKLRAAMPAAEE
jgi:hypothetical protein